MFRCLLPFFPLLLVVSSFAEEKPAVPGTAEVRAAVERSLPYLEKEGVAWMEKRKCVACHHSAFMLWSFHEAKARGIAVEDQKLADLTKQSLDLFFANQKGMLEKKNGGVESAHLLLGHLAAANPDKETLKTLGEILVNVQLEDASWKYEGQGLKPTEAENNRATTRWAVLALGVAAQAEVGSEPREKARQWLAKNTESESNESLLTRMLMEHELGDPAQAKSLLTELREQQNADGGWSWTKDRPSEAYATGESLYALARMGATGDDQAIQRGWKYLLETQQADGSWQSPTRKAKAGPNPISNYWGTAWAAIGLARTLPEVKP